MTTLHPHPNLKDMKTQNLNLMKAVFSRLRHSPNEKTWKHNTGWTKTQKMKPKDKATNITARTANLCAYHYAQVCTQHSTEQFW